MDSDRRAPSWLKATIRGALIAIAVGGGFFVLSQVLAPSEAHAETVSSSVQPDQNDSLLGPVLSGVGSTLGSVTSAAHGAVGGVGSTVSAVTAPVTGTVSTVVSTTVKTLPTPVQAPVKQLTSPVVQTVTHVTAPVTQTLASVAAARPASSVLGTASGTIDGVVSGVEQAPVIGSLVSGITGQDPVSTVTSPAAAGLDNTVGDLSGTVGATVSQTTDAVASGVSGDVASGSSPLIVGGLVPGATDDVRTGTDVSPPGADAATPVLSAEPQRAVFGPFAGGLPGRGAAGVTPALAGSAPAITGSVAASWPSGAPGTPSDPQSPLSGLSGATAGSAAGSRSGGNGSTQLAGALSTFDFPAIAAGSASLVDGDALPVSPVFENDSSPD